MVEQLTNTNRDAYPTYQKVSSNEVLDYFVTYLKVPVPFVGLGPYVNSFQLSSTTRLFYAFGVEPFCLLRPGLISSV